ncbi:MAG TPA: flagellar biosynthetic protein FliO [Myxococcaceae bacterium]|nr:flagellar biosynthetic protein FliO [Myxococcaceae bacterium]
MSPALLVLGTLLAARPTGIDALRLALANERLGTNATAATAQSGPAPESAVQAVRPAAPPRSPDVPRTTAAARRAEALRERARQAESAPLPPVETTVAAADPASRSSSTGRASDAAPSQPTPPQAASPGATAETRPSHPWAWFLPAGALLVLAGAAVLAARKRQGSPRWIRVLETSSLGPKRSLVVAQVGAETLVLGVSESGISLLTTARAPDRTDFETPPASASSEIAPERAPIPAPAAEPAHPGWTRPVPVLPADEGLRPAPPPAPRARPLLRAVPPARNRAPSPFGDLLIESAEDQELRRKLALGLTGSVS